MEQNRSGETSHTPFRTQRHFCINGEWYFLTRGGGQQGPYASRQEMEAELLMYLRETQMENERITS